MCFSAGMEELWNPPAELKEVWEKREFGASVLRMLALQAGFRSEEKDGLMD